MKKLLCIVLAMAVLTAGCNGVILSAKYSQLLDQTTAVSVETAQRAKAGTLDCNEAKIALEKQAVVWKEFQDARDGKAGK